MTVPAEYTGRQVDLLAFQLLLPGASGSAVLLAQELMRPTDGGYLISGIQKLAQKALMTLLTPIGSKLYLPQDGTRFMVDARSGNWRTTTDVMQSFYSARLDVARQLNAEKLTTDPADEQYGNMLLLSVVLAGDLVTMKILFLSAAGTSFTVLTPITVPIQ